MKTCSLCHTASVANGESWCVDCRREYLRQYRKTHKEHLKILNQEWQKNNATYSEDKFQYYSTVKGRLVELNRSAKRRAKKRSIDFSIDSEFLLELWEQQKSKCAITELDMIIPSERNDGKASPFSPSIDRIDPNQGYIKNNVRLVCYVVNCSLHDYGEKVFYLIANAYINGQLPSQEDIQNSYYYNVSQNLTAKQTKDKKYREGKAGIITAIFNQCKRHAKDSNIPFTITKDIIKELLFTNECSLTNIPFDNKLYGDHSSNPFRPSLDRSDSSKGYTEDNVRLVCVAVNYALNEFGEAVFDKICKAYLNAQ